MTKIVQYVFVCDVGPLYILSQHLCSMSHVRKCFMNLGIYGANDKERNRVQCTGKSLKPAHYVLIFCIDLK